MGMVCGYIIAHGKGNVGKKVLAGYMVWVLNHGRIRYNLVSVPHVHKNGNVRMQNPRRQE